MFDRLLGTRLGAAAVDHFAGGASGMLVGEQRGEIVTTPLNQVVATPRALDLKLFDLARVLAR